MKQITSSRSSLLPSIVRNPLLIVLLVGAAGMSLSLQGWRSQLPVFDLLTAIDAAHQLIETGELPDRGTLTSFVSFSPPGAAWLFVPGMVIFKDPRLFEFVGSVGLYLGTLLGLFLLARKHLGVSCAVLSVTLYGLSALGLNVAGSLWQRYPIHCFFVWMVYWTVRWVDENNSWFLALGLLTWGAGMYVFMEMAPAGFIFPVVWAVFRPPLRLRPLVVAAILIGVLWYPYLRFETGRAFVDLRSQVLRQSPDFTNLPEPWCDPAFARDWLETPLAFSESHSTRPWISSIAGRAKVILDMLQANFNSYESFEGVARARLNSRPRQRLPFENVRRALAGAFQLAMTAIGLTALCFGSLRVAAPSMIDRPSLWSKAFKYSGIGAIVCALLVNEVILARVVSLDGTIGSQTLGLIRTIQAIALTGGVALIVAGRRLAATLSGLARNWTARDKIPALLAVSLIVPWSVTLFISDTPVRSWWMWPLQAMVLAAAVTFLPSRLRAPRFIMWSGCLVLLFLIVGNSLSAASLKAWAKSGWSGADSDLVQIVDTVASRIRRQGQGQGQATIGYELFNRRTAPFIKTDARYRPGARVDLLLKYRHGIENLNSCAESISIHDEYRFLEMKVGGEENPGLKFRSQRLAEEGFHLIQRVGNYQAFERH